MAEQLTRLYAIMAQLRRECSWDAMQSHASLVNHLIEETCELVDALEAGQDDEIREELGDLLLQVYFHSRIAEDEGRFTLDDVARGISDKLERRHPHVFDGQESPVEPTESWEARKRIEKGRTSSLDGIAQSMSSVARAHKVISRARQHHVALDLPSENIDAKELGQTVIRLIARAQASGVDADAAIRAELRRIEGEIAATESNPVPSR